MSADGQTSSRRLAFNGYHNTIKAEPDLFLCQVGRGTPGGEYQRRFWHPVAYLGELGKVPLRVRALGEDLVAFKDGSGQVGVLQLGCCHRNTSLEYGIIEQRGLRCCYHGRLFDVDGTILEIPGEPLEEKMKSRISQGAYPTHVFGGIVFVYMGPPDRIPVFPMYDRLTLPGIKLVPGDRWAVEGNWMQIKENAVDPHHTNFLHVIPQRRGTEHFADEFGNYPEITWCETPGGIIYLAARRVEDNVWVRSAEILMSNIHAISSIFESGQERKNATPPFITAWTLPIDDDDSCTFYVSHVLEDEKMPFDKRRALESYGQIDNRSYEDKQWIPGDHEAQTGQGPINIHALEHLGTQDRGIVMFRRMVRKGIEAVQQGKDPHGFYMRQEDVPPTFANDYVAPVSEVGSNPDDPAAMRAYADKVGQAYIGRMRPMEELRG
jgi:phenylpropionate dioxygenase-like ring-hydroxylating dioxygenase large terminal subunit